MTTTRQDNLKALIRKGLHSPHKKVQLAARRLFIANEKGDAAKTLQRIKELKAVMARVKSPEYKRHLENKRNYGRYKGPKFATMVRNVARSGRALTQIELAELFGVTRTTLVHALQETKVPGVPPVGNNELAELRRYYKMPEHKRRLVAKPTPPERPALHGRDRAD